MPCCAGDGAFVFQLFKQALKVNAGIALDPEGPRDIAFGQKGGVIKDPLADLVFCGHRVHALALSRVALREKPQRALRRAGCEWGRAASIKQHHWLEKSDPRADEVSARLILSSRDIASGRKAGCRDCFAGNPLCRIG